MNNWYTIKIQNLTETFAYDSSLNQYIQSWKVPSDCNLDNMFLGATDMSMNYGDLPYYYTYSQVDGINTLVPTPSYLFFNQGLQLTNDQSNNIYNVLEQWYDSSGGNSPEFNDSTTVPYYGPIDKWQTSLVTDMNNLFSTANNAQSSSFNENIMFWDVSNVTNMSGMFEGAVIFNQDISKWKTGLVTTMANMFRNASSFNQNIATWDISKVLFMNGMFYNATSFNQSISIWAITNNQINFSNMFYNATDMSNNYAAPVTPTIDYFNKGEPIPNNETLVTLCQIYSIDPESPMFTNNKVKPYYSSIEN